MTVADGGETTTEALKAPPARGRGRPKSGETKVAVSPRLRLIQAAIPLFALHGYDAVSTAQIAVAADLSQPMVHYHFQSKDRIWYVAMETLMRDLSKRFPNRREELKDLEPISRLKVLTRRFILMSASDTTLSRVVLHESLTQSDRLAWLVRRYIARAFRDFDQAIQEGVDAGVVKPLADYAISNTIVSASAFTFCLAGMVRLVYDRRISDEAVIREMADSIIEIIFHGIVRTDPPNA